MENIGQATAVIVDKLTAAGIAACADMRDLNPPAVLVSAPVIDWDRLTGYTATWQLYAVVPNAGRLAALDTLGTLIEQVRAVWPVEHGDPVDLPSLDTADPLPAYRLPLQQRVCED